MDAVSGRGLVLGHARCGFLHRSLPMTSCMWLDLMLAMENLRPISDSGGCFGIALRFGSLGYNRQSLHELCK